VICGIAATCNLVGGEQHFGGIFYLRLRVDLQAEYSSEKFVSSYKTKNRHNSLKIHGREDLKSFIICGV
jgi:hypothetical protein